MSQKRPERGLSRRRFLQGIGAGAGLIAAPAILASGRSRAGDSGSELFSLGVASGDPAHDSVVLWTRLASDPLNGGGMPQRPVVVDWAVATDPDMGRVIRRGVVTALPQDGHAVHVVARGLPSNQWLYYQFRAMGAQSRIGRTRTFPGPRDRVERLRFAVANCQNYEQGFYPAYRDMLGQGLDFVVHVGDYIYEDGPSSLVIAPGRSHTGGEVITVEDYRNRYALYRLDKDLQDAHALYPFVVTPDDHEVDNNYAGLIPEQTSPTQGEEFVRRRLNAYQVYSKTMPLRPTNRQHGKSSELRLFRRLQFGDLADLHVLDTRQYRTDQPAGDGFGSTDPDSLALEGVLGEALFDADGIQDPKATLLGAQQEAWLARNLAQSRARWNILAQQVMVMPWNLIESGRANVALDPNIPGALKEQLLPLFDQVDDLLNVDAWDGYQAARQRLLGMLERIRPTNPVIVTGDIHSAWAADLLSDFADPENADMLAAEFVATSISSTFLAIDPRPANLLVRQSIGDNPHIRYFNGLFRGYCLCDVDTERWETTYRAVGDLKALTDPDPLALVPYPDTPVATDAVFTVNAGFNAPGSGERVQGWSRLPATGPLG
ncbi:MAG: alkaline phosphatase D family protein [Chromatiaceae bacterium]|jgi:alkaline phosphatase D|nr:alkaline phosphatase D family protein [Chromatiaceae bacterium]